MSRILILSLVFPPDGVSTAQLMGELAVDLAKRGHEVAVVTTRPHFNRDREAEDRQPVVTMWGGLFARSEHAGIPVIHTYMPRKSQSVAGRLLGWMGFHLLSTVAALFMVRRPDVLFCPSPPLTICVSAWLVGLLRRCPFVYNVQEIYPDIAIKLGALKNGFAIGALRHLERWSYRKAAVVTVIAPKMRQNLSRKGVPESKLYLIPNFVDVNELCPGPRENAFRAELGLGGRFVVSYAGNLGPTQGLETVVEAAERLRSDREVAFVIVGGGSAEEALRRMASEKRLENVTILPYRPYSTMNLIYAASDVSLVLQTLQTGADAVPSKVYRIMACARAVLAISDPTSDLSDVVAEAGCGLTVSPGCPEELAAAIKKLKQDPNRLRVMGEAGRVYVEGAVSRQRVTEQYDSVLTGASRGPARR